MLPVEGTSRESLVSITVYTLCNLNAACGISRRFLCCSVPFTHTVRQLNNGWGGGGAGLGIIFCRIDFRHAWFVLIWLESKNRKG